MKHKLFIYDNVDDNSILRDSIYKVNVIDYDIGIKKLFKDYMPYSDYSTNNNSIVEIDDDKKMGIINIVLKSITNIEPIRKGINRALYTNKYLNLAENIDNSDNVNIIKESIGNYISYKNKELQYLLEYTKNFPFKYKEEIYPLFLECMCQTLLNNDYDDVFNNEFLKGKLRFTTEPIYSKYYGLKNTVEKLNNIRNYVFGNPKKVIDALNISLYKDELFTLINQLSDMISNFNNKYVSEIDFETPLFDSNDDFILYINNYFIFKFLIPLIRFLKITDYTDIDIFKILEYNDNFYSDIIYLKNKIIEKYLEFILLYLVDSQKSIDDYLDSLNSKIRRNLLIGEI